MRRLYLGKEGNGGRNYREIIETIRPVTCWIHYRVQTTYISTPKGNAFGYIDRYTYHLLPFTISFVFSVFFPFVSKIQDNDRRTQ